MNKLIVILLAVGLVALTGLTLTYVHIITLLVPPEIASTPVVQAKVVQLPLPENVESHINQFRADRGLAPFNTEVTALDQAAQARAEGMCTDNDWSHTKDWDVLNQYYTYSHAGENLYYGSLQENQAADAVHDWSLSPSHLATIVGSYSEIGIGVKSCPGFQGNQTAVIITNYFGVPR